MPAVPRQHREDEGQPVAIDSGRRAAGRHDLGRRDQRLNLDQQRPGPLHRAEHHRSGRRPRLADEAGGGVDDLDEAALPHLEDADLAGRAEAVLERAQGPEGPLPLALEVQDAVDQVLERPRPGERPLLGHVPDQDQGDVEPLGGLEQRRGRLPHGADAAGRGVGDRRGSAPSRSRRRPAARPRAPPARSRATARRASAPTAPPRRVARLAAGPAPRTPRRRRRGRRAPPRRCWRAPSPPACSCRSPARRRAGRGNPARGPRREPGRARRCLCRAARSAPP